MIASIRPLTFGDLAVNDTFRIANSRGNPEPTLYRKADEKWATPVTAQFDSRPLAATALVVRGEDHATQ